MGAMFVQTIILTSLTVIMVNISRGITQLQVTKQNILPQTIAISGSHFKLPTAVCTDSSTEKYFKHSTNSEDKD